MALCSRAGCASHCRRFAPAAPAAVIVAGAVARTALASRWSMLSGPSPCPNLPRWRVRGPKCSRARLSRTILPSIRSERVAPGRRASGPAVRPQRVGRKPLPRLELGSHFQARCHAGDAFLVAASAPCRASSGGGGGGGALDARARVRRRPAPAPWPALRPRGAVATGAQGEAQSAGPRPRALHGCGTRRPHDRRRPAQAAERRAGTQAGPTGGGAWGAVSERVSERFAG